MSSFEVEAPDPRRFQLGLPKVVCPVRFTRFRGDIAGFTTNRSDNLKPGRPPVDDFGFALSGAPRAHGPSVSFRAKDGKNNDFTVQMVRDRLTPEARLFPTIADPTVVELVAPAPGGSLPRMVPTPFSATGFKPYDMDDDKIVLRALPGAERSTFLELHYGSASGPVVAQLRLKVLPVLQIPVKVHDVTIHTAAASGGSPGTSPAHLKTLFDDINVVFEQAGVELVFAEPEAGGVPKINAVDNTASKALYASVDTVSQFGEIIDVLALGNGANVLNAYIVRRFGGAQASLIGFGMPQSRAAEIRALPASTPPLPIAQPGIILLAEGNVPPGADSGLVSALRLLLVHTLAHEIGHCLELSHFDRGEETTHDIRHDTEAHSNLMHNFADLQTSGAKPAGNDPNLYNSALRASIGYAKSVFLDQNLKAQTMTHTGQALDTAQVFALRTAVLGGSYKRF